MSTKTTTFKSSATEKRWVELQKEKAELQAKKQTDTIKGKIEVINSLMTACKVGFNLSEAKVKKVLKHLREITDSDKIKYGIIPEGLSPKSTLFKDTVIVYTENDGQVIFKELEK